MVFADKVVQNELGKLMTFGIRAYLILSMCLQNHPLAVIYFQLQTLPKTFSRE
jgi:hypothetical protein